MNSRIRQDVSLIGVPMDLGADRRGVDMGPSAIRCAGLESRLEQLGYAVHDEGDLVVRRAKAYSSVPESNLKYLYEIVRVNEELAEAVAGIIARKRFPLVLGGDHSIAIGTLAGILRHKENVGVIWYDAHGDVNTADTSPSGNIHGMALAVAMGYGHPALTGIGGERRKVKPDNVVIVGSRSLDPGEQRFLKEKGVTVYTMHEVDRLGVSRVMEQTLDQVTRGTDGVHLSLDLDGLDPKEAPGVGTPIPAGMSLRESLLAVEILSDAGVVTSAEFVEVNPTLDIRNETAKIAVELIASLLGEKIM
ncbi:arginase [Paenibacillus flagellatus]|uniref:Arginase n=1 Tax=Paenibacillus flagellatus TaxID=2211139 RepID=A0A2V5K1R3_9BACL|nr:arginase [Paenibacillus flagellatus]PYI52562.1 arginase [Paenibacillus flagellatus]